MLILTAFLCGLFTCNRMSIMRFLAHFGLAMDSVIIFMTTPEKWLKSACSAVICGLYDGGGAAGARMYPGRFTFQFSDFNVEKPLVVLLIRHL